MTESYIITITFMVDNLAGANRLTGILDSHGIEWVNEHDGSVFAHHIPSRTYDKIWDAIGDADLGVTVKDARWMVDGNLVIIE